MTSSTAIRVHEPPVSPRRANTGPTDAGERASITLLGEPRDVTVGRAFVRRVLAAAAADGNHDDAVLVVSELVTNALLAGCGPITLEIAAYRHQAIVWVTHIGRPALVTTVNDDNELRPLDLVARLTHNWWTETGAGRMTTVAIVSIRPAGQYCSAVRLGRRD